MVFFSDKKREYVVENVRYPQCLVHLKAMLLRCARHLGGAKHYNRTIIAFIFKELVIQMIVCPR